MLRDATHYADQLLERARAAQQLAWREDHHTALVEYVAHVQRGGDPATGPREPRTSLANIPDGTQGATWCLILWWPTGFKAPARTSREVLPVVVNHGRWLVECPCGGSQLACRTDPRFFCVDCLNEWTGGAWVNIAWPARPDFIDMMLSSRPLQLQNWSPGDDLVTENEYLRATAGSQVGAR